MLLADNIETLLNNLELRIRLGTNAKKTIEDRFGIENMIKSFFNTYNMIYPKL